MSQGNLPQNSQPSVSAHPANKPPQGYIELEAALDRVEQLLLRLSPERLAEGEEQQQDRGDRPTSSNASSTKSSGAKAASARSSQSAKLSQASDLLPASTTTPQNMDFADALLQIRASLSRVLDSYDHQVEQIQQQSAQSHSVASITQRIRQSLDPGEILNSTVIEVRQALQADRVVIHSFEDDAGSVIVAESVVAPWPSLLGERTSQAIAEQRIAYFRQGHYRIVDDIETGDYSPELLAIFRQQQTRAVLVAPILRDDQLLGLLSVHQCSGIRHWLPHEVDLLRYLSEQVAIALQQSRLYQQAQQLNADLEQQIVRRAEQMERVLKYESMLKRITDKVRDSLDESQILQAAVQELTLVLGLAGCNSALYDLEEGTSTIRYEYTHSIPTFYGRVAQMDDSPDIYHQLKQGLYFQFCSLYPNPQRGRVAMLACPIFVDANSSEGMEQAVLGDLWLIHRKEYVFNEFEIRMVQQVANQCAIAIRQARLYQAAQAQVTELERLNQLKDQFLSTVSHELRTPIANVKMAIHMLKTAPSEEKQKQYLSILESELAREEELINDLLDLQRLEESVFPITVERIDLPNWLPALVEPFRTRIANSQQTLEVSCPEDLPPLVTDPTILRRILAELLNNACKYTPKGLSIALEVSLQPPTEENGFTAHTIFRLQNQAEIPKADLPHIFEKFYRVLQVDRYRHGGTGLGLALVQKLVEQLGGTISADSADGWTSFTVRIPSR
ncbi:sensor histidine kinase [Leptolyngbya sp. O-77]|uniref:sensor histidine kinase n=1 Tax=Leptolyngbya sp. O-77 TaxID=1080068 RepID=UPI00074D3E70|nr:GAF domain-containing sensor histidine kinase [Leptolyngbya sp. O-77]BAU41782.1 Alkaline phosphatase synthesis sensor protein PhoR [Leptolyngbya sp. O-77]